jgi:hypothetical protein
MVGSPAVAPWRYSLASGQYWSPCVDLAAAFYAGLFKIVLASIAIPQADILPNWNAVAATFCLQRPQGPRQRRSLVDNDLDSHL